RKVSFEAKRREASNVGNWPESANSSTEFAATSQGIRSLLLRQWGEAAANQSPVDRAGKAGIPEQFLLLFTCRHHVSPHHLFQSRLKRKGEVRMSGIQQRGRIRFIDDYEPSAGAQCAGAPSDYRGPDVLRNLMQ